jgi:hypothetical protein
MPMNLYHHPAELGPPVLDSVLAPSTPPEMNIVIPKWHLCSLCCSMDLVYKFCFCSIESYGVRKKTLK